MTQNRNIPKRSKLQPANFRLTKAMQDAHSKKPGIIFGYKPTSTGGGGVAVRVGSSNRRNAKRRPITLAEKA